MKKRLCLFLALASVSAIVVPLARAASYYVDCVNGADKSDNPGTSPSQAWKTLGRVNGFVPGQVYPGNSALTDAGFNGGDTLYLKRGCSWDWHLVFTPTSGTPPTASGNFNGANASGPAFTVGSYGNGSPPTIQAEIAVPAPLAAWAHLSGNIYYATVQSLSQGTGWNPSNVSMVKFGSVWGACKGQQVAGSPTPYCVGSNGTAALAANFDWYYSSSAVGQGCTSNCGTVSTLYVYDSIGTNPTVDLGAVTSVLDGGGQLVSINGVGHVTLQHLKLLNQSWYGIEVSGASDNLIFANVYADTEVPFNFHGEGFYLHPSGGSSNIQLLNTESHRGYYGYQFSADGASGTGITALTLSNCKSYFDRNYAVADLTNLLSANVTSVQVASNSLTVTANNSFTVGNGVTFHNLGNATFLNTQTVTVLTANSTQFTASFTHANYGPTSESVGTAALAIPIIGTAVAYDHCHFYGNGVGSPIALDVEGGVAGAGNIAPNTDPHIASWHNYTPRFTLTYRGPGFQFGSDVALNAQLPALGTAPLSIGIATNYSYAGSLISQFNAWLAAGYDLNSMGLSAASYANANTFTVKYTGTCTAAALTISGGPPATTFAITASGGTCPGGDSFSFSIGSASTLAQLKAALIANGKYTVAWVQPCGSCAWIAGSAMLAQDLAALSGQDVRTATYSVALNVDQFLKDETAKSQTWVQTNLTGWGTTWVYLYPATLFNPTSAGVPTIEQDVAGSGSPAYKGAVGASSMELGRDGLSGAFDAVASNGVDAQGLSTYSLAGWANLTPIALQASVQAAVEQASAWGVPLSLYWQSGFISNGQLALVVADLQAAGATLMTNRDLVSFLYGKASVATLPSGFCACWAWTPEVGTFNLAPTYLSPTVGAGATLSGSYQSDLNGVTQPQIWSAINAATSATVSKTGWDIGAQAVVPSFTGGLRPGH
jgi:hypothetical protein